MRLKGVLSAVESAYDTPPEVTEARKKKAEALEKGENRRKYRSVMDEKMASEKEEAEKKRPKLAY